MDLNQLQKELNKKTIELQKMKDQRAREMDAVKQRFSDQKHIYELERDKLVDQYQAEIRQLK